MEEQALVGILERITYQNPENSFLIGRFLPEEARMPITVKGRMFNVHEGQTLKLWGGWEEHRDYGRQFAVSAFLVSEPTTLEGMERYLASGIIKGVGKVLAGRIVKTFGETTFQVIDETPEKLLRVPKFPRKALAAVKTAWKEQKAIRDIMVFLHAQGISQAYADKIYNTYGFTSVEVLKENPYRLAMDVRGIGFRIADGIAASLGVGKDSPQRAEAGVVYVMEEITGEGHTGLPRPRLVERATAVLEQGLEMVEGAVDTLISDGLLKALPPELSPDGEVYLARPRMHRAERAIAENLARIAGCEAATRFSNIGGGVERLEKETGIYLAEEQRRAVLAALDHKLLIVTGGPGTGKTTIIRFILGLAAPSLPNVALCAPTGRAAKRLAEATGRPASTIHRLLEAGAKGFERGRERPIEAELVIADESSMIDTLLMEALLDAVPAQTRLVLVGDVDQLPSVGPGMVLADLIASQRIPVVRLEEIFRQSERSRITANAHLIRKGQLPDLSLPDSDDLVDFYFLPESDPARIVEKILVTVTERIPERFQFDPKSEVQVITPMHKGLTGAQNLNSRLQQALNPEGEEIVFGDNRFRVGDKVMQTRNDYEKEVFNGDMGEITAYDKDAGLVAVSFDEREVIYERKELDAIALGYAITVHKSQGSEYPAVVLSLTTQHAIMLQRNLLYTAITRARRLLVLLGTEKAVRMALNNVRPEMRHTRLRQRLTMEGEASLHQAAP
ncbi:MAG: ATP-dependent RecD-like DNA helicase [SAR324 cluster bacterium]|nr:ATP-dependent RecD-like DNA helicase [SAR324 cluster bacterium]